MSISITDIQNKLYEWVTTESGVTVIWRFQNMPRPNLPYIDLHVNPLVQIGHDYVSRPTSPTSGSKIWGNREFTLTINYYGVNSLQALENLRSSLEKPTIQELLDEESIAYVDRLGITNLPELLDSRFEDRSMMDLLFRVPSEITDSDVGIVETVKIEKTFKDAEQQTVYNDIETIP